MSVLDRVRKKDEHRVPKSLSLGGWVMPEFPRVKLSFLAHYVDWGLGVRAYYEDGNSGWMPNWIAALVHVGPFALVLEYSWVPKETV